MSWAAKPSVQRIRTSRVIDDPAGAYFDWVDASVPGVRVARTGETVDMHLFGSTRPAISLLVPSEARDGYQVCGGMFVADPPGGEFIFVQRGAHDLEVTLKGFTPRLPRPIFLLTHSVVHEFVMWSFKQHLERLLLEQEST